WVRRGTSVLAVIATIALSVIAAVLWSVRGVPAPGDIASALSQHPELYTLSMGHMADLTLRAFAYLRLPLVLAAIAALTGVAGMTFYRRNPRYLYFAIAFMMLIFLHAARLAMIT